jgi:Uma2 family endonuclease
MAMPQLVRRYTVADLDDFPDDGNRYELIRGALHVSPPPARRHQRIVQRLFLALHAYLEPLGLGETVFGVPGGVSWNDHNFLIPDIFVAPLTELATRWNRLRHLHLACEVISPGSSRRDRVEKRELYLNEIDVETYWIVDPDDEVIEVWRPGDDRPEIVRDALTWRITGEAPLFRLALPDLFQGS